MDRFLRLAGIGSGFAIGVLIAVALDSCTAPRTVRVDPPRALTPTAAALPKVVVVPRGSRVDWLDCLMADRFVRPWNREAASTCTEWRGL